MGEQLIIELGRSAITVALLVAAPVLVVTTLVGLGISIFQAVTQINEMTLTFVPKILAVVVVLGMLGPWAGNTLLTYTVRLLTELPALAH